MKVPEIVNVDDTPYKIFVSGEGSSVRVITYPQSITLQDSIEEMLEDIGVWDIEYLKEVYADNATFTVS
jgi:hypothetical protein